VNLDLPRVLIIGCGVHATDILVPAVMSIGRAHVVGFCDLDADRANTLAHRFNVQAAGTSPRDMIDKFRPDAVILAGPPTMHVDVATYAFTAGAHVLVEKPPAVSTGDLQQMVSAAESSRRVGMVAHNLRYTAAWRRAMERIAITNVESITVEYHASGPVGSRWGLAPDNAFLLSHAVHALDLLNHVLGPPAATMHDLRAVGDGRFVLSTLWRSHRGVLGIVVVSTCAPRFDWTVQIATTDACLIRIASASEVILQRPRTADQWGTGQRDVWRTRALDAGFDSAGYGAELHYFFDCISGKGAAAPSLADELPVYRALDELRQQAGLDRSLV
jgi:predicted dehydrogenase